MPKVNRVTTAFDKDDHKDSRADIAWRTIARALGNVGAADWALQSWIVNDRGDIAAIFTDIEGDTLTCWYAPGYVFPWRE